MNEQLKFSWGHIISFLALIFISFVTFDGVVYFTDGDFKSAGIVMSVVDALLLLFFIGAQCLKATERRFSSGYGLSGSLSACLLSLSPCLCCLFSIFGLSMAAALKLWMGLRLLSLPQKECSLNMRIIALKD